MMHVTSAERVGIAHGTSDAPGDLLVGPSVVTGTLLCCGGIIQLDGSIESWSSVWSSAVRYRVRTER